MLRRWLGALVAAVLALGVAPALAGAEEQPAILKAYGLDWIERVKEEAWPQPRLQRPVLCLLDTGVNVTPDTPADDPNGPIVARLALDGGDGFAQGEGHPYDHGTQMASIIAAPRNSWGTVGVFPQARIVSIRVTEGTEGFMTPGGIRQGVRRCFQFAGEHGLQVAVVSIAESNYQQRQVDITEWELAVALAKEGGALVVAAVGNDADAGAVAPLAVPTIIGVSAGNDSGDVCAFVQGLKQESALRGPGCSRGVGWPAGSSAAASAVSALIAALRTRAPLATAPETRSAVEQASVSSADSTRVVKASALARGFPLADEIPADPPAVLSGIAVAQTPASTPVAVKLWRPEFRAKWRGRVLTVTRLDRRAAGRLAIECGEAASTKRRISTALARSLRMGLARRPKGCRGWVESKAPGAWRSLSVRLALR